jgi:hypothetical protein
MSILRALSLAFAVAAMLAPIAHVLEMSNKFQLGGSVWLLFQQQLYRGWGPFLGGPAEIGALATSLLLALHRRRNRTALALTTLACAAYAGMIVTFFVLNAPVNEAVASVTPATLPRTG